MARLLHDGIELETLVVDEVADIAFGKGGDPESLVQRDAFEAFDKNMISNDVVAELGEKRFKISFELDDIADAKRCFDEGVDVAAHDSPLNKCSVRCARS